MILDDIRNCHVFRTEKVHISFVLSNVFAGIYQFPTLVLGSPAAICDLHTISPLLVVSLVSSTASPPA